MTAGAAFDAFLQAAPGGGHRLYLHHQPPLGTVLRGALLYVHPWAEEMNKSRRMAATAARAMAAAGWSVLQLDLLGCGDSSGDFGDASWDDWVADVVAAACWLQARHSGVQLWLWGLRSGALLCAAAARELRQTPFNHLYWHPVIQGKSQLQQFMRLKAAAQWADGNAGAVLQTLRAQLAQGQPVEIAGYALAPALARDLEAVTLRPDGLPPARLIWLEMQTAADATLSPAAQSRLLAWEASGWSVQAAVVQGPAFWQTTEIEDAPALVTATCAALIQSMEAQLDTAADRRPPAATR